jgi:DNA repair ATPase RecN
MMGSVSVAPDAGALEGLRFLLNVINLITNRDEAAAQLRELADAMGKYNRVRAELEQREFTVLGHQRDYERQSAALDARRKAIDEASADLQRREQRLAEERAALDAVKAEMRTAMAA